ncbi:TlpA family protein disulfide reductase [Candidatus Nomurabacteria bacterium]|nr:TlpA family protein disulfide reductase [Candidatus Nomurabacteria bacterium]
MSQQRTAFVTLALLGCVLLLAALSVQYYLTHRQQTAYTPDARKAAQGVYADSQFVDLSGKPVSLDPTTPRIEVINLWASWSPHSREELISLDQMAAAMGTSTVRFVAVNRDEPEDVARAFVASLGGLPHLTVVIDTTDGMYKDIEAYAMPETVVFAKDGSKLLQVRGVVDPTELKDTIEAARSN